MCIKSSLTTRCYNYLLTHTFIFFFLLCSPHLCHKTPQVYKQLLHPSVPQGFFFFFFFLLYLPFIILLQEQPINMTVSDTKTNSAVSHNGPMQHNDPSHNASSQISSTTTHTQVKGHRRGSSLPALRHLEQMGRDSAQYEDDSEDDDGDDDHGCLDTPHDNSDLDDFVKGFCDSDNMHDVDSRVWVVQSRSVALD